MTTKLDRTSRRVIGVLIEKELTTPNLYPLTLNALINGCNQKSNRDPVLQLQEFEVEGVLRSLYVNEWVTNSSQAGSRALKWKHRALERLGVDDAELAVMAELMLRGSQQPGELRSRVKRMHDVGSMGRMEELLDGLIAKGLARRLERRPGERAVRYDHTLYPEGEGAATPAEATPAEATPAEATPAETTPAETTPAETTPVTSIQPPVTAPETGDLAERVRALEDEVARLRSAVEALRPPDPSA